MIVFPVTLLLVCGLLVISGLPLGHLMRSSNPEPEAGYLLSEAGLQGPLTSE